MSFMEVFDFVDKRMVEHRDTAVLECFGADDGEGGEGSCSSSSLERKYERQMAQTAFAFGSVERGIASLTGNAQVLLFRYWSRESLFGDY